MKKQLRAAWLIGAGCVLASCSMPRVHYYTLEIPHSSPAVPKGIALHLTVQRFLADHVLRDDRILYRESPNEVSFYEYHRWAGPPAELVTNYFTHRLKDSGSFARVTSYKEGSQADFALHGRLHRFEEVDRGKEALASVSLELELVDMKSRVPIWRGEAECTRPLPTKDIPGLVNGIYDCLQETATKLLDAMQKTAEKQQ